MNATGTTASLALLLALVSGQAMATSTTRALPDFSPPASRAAGVDAQRLPQAWRSQPTFRMAPTRAPRAVDNSNNAVTMRNLRQRALQSVLSSPEQAPALDEERGDGGMNLHFHRNGGLRDFNKSYREMCKNLSAKIWDDPNGRSVRFDIAGKPGIGVEIPIGRARR